jgi:hypothetical protein
MGSFEKVTSAAEAAAARAGGYRRSADSEPDLGRAAEQAGLAREEAGNADRAANQAVATGEL